MKKPAATTTAEKPAIRCAIYTRKSTEEGLQQAFNTLDAQRDSAEAYIASQKNEGWVCLPDRYDDGGFTGGNLDRPAVQRLMKDIEAGKVDCVVVYKVDRLSRSLMDFARMMATFDDHKVSFVSVTQHFNTTHSMGRLTLNILLSFAQFEREIISERTRDKIAAARRKGKFAGGKPVLGYDLLSDPTGSKLVVNDDEAARVREIFELYLKHQALIPTVMELDTLGWTTKRWVCKAGATKGGRPFDKNALFKLLTNVVYIGKVRYHEEIHPGEHTAIVDEQIWQRVQAVLQRNRRTGGAMVKNKHGALLKGLLRCAPCKCSMGHAYTSHGTKRYRYYVCLRAQKRGWHNCPTKSVPAGEIEQFVIEQIRSMGRDPRVLAEIVRQSRGQGERSLAELQREEQSLKRELGRHVAELGNLPGDSGDGQRAGHLASIQDRIRAAEQRTIEVREQIVALSREMVNEREVEAAMAMFSPVWETLNPQEQARIIHLLVERVDYDGGHGTVSVTFRANGIKTLAQHPKEIAA
jgi:site-specific DNA recombinase